MAVESDIIGNALEFFPTFSVIVHGSLGFVGAYNQEIVHVAFWKRQMK